MKSLIPLPWFVRQRIEPKIYRVFCRECDFSEEVELPNPAVTVCKNPDCDHSGERRQAEELPKTCPKCANKLKSECIPVKLRY